jgi:16S rRNA (uracil1498-N3)-methyltransferase
MRRYWIPEDSKSETHVVLSGDIFHHICVVCRQGVGDRFEVICDGKAYFVEIESSEKKSAVAKILEERELPALPQPEIHLALSLPKFTTVDKTIEKMVELGVAKVHLFTSDFSYMKAGSRDLNKKRERWHKIIRGATQQTGRGDLMELTEVTPLNVLLSENFPARNRAGLLAYEGEEGEPLKDRMDNLPANSEQVWIFVGSEGGFSSKDLELFKDYKLLPVTLGDQVLRVETACVTLVGILRYGLGHYD